MEETYTQERVSDLPEDAELCSKKAEIKPQNFRPLFFSLKKKKKKERDKNM